MSDIELSRSSIFSSRFRRTRYGLYLEHQYINFPRLKSGKRIMVKAIFYVQCNWDCATELAYLADAVTNIWALHFRRPEDCMALDEYKSLTKYLMMLTSPHFVIDRVIVSTLLPRKFPRPPVPKALPPSPSEKLTSELDKAQSTYKGLIHWERNSTDPEVWNDPMYGKNMQTLLNHLKNQIIDGAFESDDDSDDDDDF